MSAPTHWEMIALAWAARAIGAAALALLLVFAAWWIVDQGLRVAGRWNTIFALARLWYGHAKQDRAKLWRAVEKWDAWDHDAERDRAIAAESERLRWYYQQREAYLRKVYAADEMPDDTEPAVDGDGLGTDRRDDIV